MEDENKIYRLSWTNGPVFAEINKKEIADSCFKLISSSWPGQVKMTVITIPQLGYGKDERGEE